MTITATVPKKGYVASGGNSFAFPFKVASASDLLVYRNSVLLTTGVTINGLGDPNGGVVVITPTPSVGDTIWLVRATVRSQGTDWTANDPDPAESKENAFDKAMSIDQEQDELLVRIPSFAFDNPNVLSPRIDAPVTGKFAQAKDSFGNIGWATPAVGVGTLSDPVSFAQGGTSGSYANRAALLQGLQVAQFAKGSDLTSAATLVLPNPLDGGLFYVLGTTTIGGISTAGVPEGTLIGLVLGGAIQFTDGASFQLFGRINHTFANGDVSFFRLFASGLWREVYRQPAPVTTHQSQFWRGDGTWQDIGTWVSVSYNAANFVGGGGMTWTVEAGDVNTYAYVLIGKTMTVSFWISTSSVGGTPNPVLRIAIPAGKVAARAMRNTIEALDAGSAAAGIASVVLGNTTIDLYKDMGASTNWSLSTNTTYVVGQITFEVQ